MLKLQILAKISAILVLAISVLFIFQNCSKTKDGEDGTLSTLGIDGVLVTDKSTGAVLKSKKIEVGDTIVIGVADEIAVGKTLQLNQMEQTTANCTIAAVNLENTAHEITCTSQGTLVVEAILREDGKPDLIATYTFSSVAAGDDGPAVTEFDFSPTATPLNVLTRNTLTYKYRKPNPFVMPTFTTLPSSTTQCQQKAHVAGTFTFVCDHPGVWVVEGVQKGSYFPKTKSFEIVLPSNIARLFPAKIKSGVAGSLSSVAQTTMAKGAQIDVSKPVTNAGGFVFNITPVSESGAACQIQNGAGTILKSILCSGVGEAVVEASIQWPSGTLKKQRITLKFK